MNATICDHKDCERTDASPLEMHLFSRDGELIETYTFQFCLEHREQLLSIEESKTLPPREWFAPGYMPDVRSPR
jgi:hypothetical protein